MRSNIALMMKLSRVRTKSSNNVLYSIASVINALKMKDVELVKVNEIMEEFKKAFQQYNDDKQQILVENK